MKHPVEDRLFRGTEIQRVVRELLALEQEALSFRAEKLGGGTIRTPVEFGVGRSGGLRKAADLLTELLGGGGA